MRRHSQRPMSNRAKVLPTALFIRVPDFLYTLSIRLSNSDIVPAYYNTILRINYFLTGVSDSWLRSYGSDG